MFLTNFCRWHCSRIWSMSLCASGCRSEAGPRQKSFVWGTSCSYWWFRGPENLSWPESSTIINVNFTKTCKLFGNSLLDIFGFLVSKLPWSNPTVLFNSPVCPLCDQISSERSLRSFLYRDECACSDNLRCMYLYMYAMVRIFTQY